MTHEHGAGLEEEEEHQYFALTLLTLAHGGLLFALGIMRVPMGGGDDGEEEEEEEDEEEIVCFNAQTLKVRHRFGRGMFGDGYRVCGMAAVGNELFVLVGAPNNSIKIFSLFGAHLRSFGLGDCAYPRQLHHFDGRLYLIDHHTNYEDTRIVVLTLEGERLQVWTPDAGRALNRLLGIYGRKLLIRTTAVSSSDWRLEALQGI